MVGFGISFGCSNNIIVASGHFLCIYAVFTHSLLY